MIRDQNFLTRPELRVIAVAAITAAAVKLAEQLVEWGVEKAKERRKGADGEGD